MANKRFFKKYVEDLTEAVVNDMMALSCITEGINKEVADKAMISLLVGSETAIVKINIKFDKTGKAFENAKQYRAAKAKFYKQIYTIAAKDFGKCVKESLEQFNSAFPEKAEK